MKVATAQSDAGSAKAAIHALVRQLEDESGECPDFVALNFGAEISPTKLRSEVLRYFQRTALHAGSSCLGTMGKGVLNIASKGGIGALAIWDPEGSYGSAAANLGKDASSTAKETLRKALLSAGRVGEVPDLVLLTTAPGREEQVLSGLRSVIGDNAVIIGGTSADNDVSGNWYQFGTCGLYRDGLVVSVLFPSSPISFAYQSGYAPTGKSGIITQAEGRKLFQLDTQPAAAIYSRWTDGQFPSKVDRPLTILDKATFWPLGRVTHQVAGVPFYKLAHPSTIGEDGSIDLFADISVGERVWQMSGSPESLISRAKRVAHQAISDAKGAPKGALVIYCGGCMLAIQDRMDEVHAGIDQALGGIPWLGIFTFGEQGATLGHPPQHSNLMISCVVLTG